MRLSFVAGVLLFLGCNCVHAVTVLLDGTNATGVLALDVDSVLYDVSFEYITGTPENPITSYGAGDIFAENPGAAQRAVNAIIAAIKAAGATTVGHGSTGNGSNTFIVPYSFANSCMDFCAYRGFRSGSSWLNLDSDIDELASIEFARFAPAVATVPLPPAAYMLGSGLALLGGVGKRINRRQNNKNSTPESVVLS